MPKKNINHTGSEAWMEEYKKYLGNYAEGFEEHSKDIAYDLEKFHDPVIVGAMIHRLIQERKKSNAMFQAILEELKTIRSLLESVSHPPSPSPHTPVTSGITPGVSEVDKQILDLVKDRGSVTADEVRKILGYKGRNAASARLNRLWELGLLTKKRAGRKVYYSARVGAD